MRKHLQAWPSLLGNKARTDPPKWWLCQLAPVLFLGDLKTLRGTGMCSACDVQITQLWKQCIWILCPSYHERAQVKPLKDYRTTFHAQNCPEGAKGRVLSKRIGNGPEKLKVYCIKLITDATPSVSTSRLFQHPKLWQHEGAVRKKTQHFHRVTVVQKRWCPWAQSPKKRVTSRLLGSKAIFRRETNQNTPTTPGQCFLHNLSMTDCPM